MGRYKPDGTRYKGLPERSLEINDPTKLLLGN